MTVDPATAKHSFEYQGTTYYFCGAGCRTKFAAEPDKWLRPTPKEPPHPARRTSHPAPDLYTCPMHPEIVQRGPGSCPICGMALEPKTISISDTANPELADMSHR